MSNLLFVISITFGVLTITSDCKRVEFFKQFTNREGMCPRPPIDDESCRCSPYGSKSYNWFIFDDKTDIAFGPDKHDYKFYQISSIVSELSQDGYVVISDKFECPDDGEACSIKIYEQNLFSVTSRYDKISSMSLSDWNKLLRRTTPSRTFTASYECVLEPKQSGYLVIHPMMEKVLGWAYDYWCYTAVCWPFFHPCNLCPRIDYCGQDYCIWIGKAPKINFKDGTIIGQRRCVIADNEYDALYRVNNQNTSSEFIRLPYKNLQLWL